MFLLLALAREDSDGLPLPPVLLGAGGSSWSSVIRGAEARRCSEPSKHFSA